MSELLKGRAHPTVTYERTEAHRAAVGERTRGRWVGDRSPNYRHGMTNSPTYVSWLAMKGRCLNPANRAYPHYGGRGIGVCERWLTFTNFLADMGVRPDGRVLGRIDHARGYEPGNVEWTTPTENTAERNQRLPVPREARNVERARRLRDALRAHPEWSNVTIKAAVGVGNDAVARARRELEEAGEIPRLAPRFGRAGGDRVAGTK